MNSTARCLALLGSSELLRQPSSTWRTAIYPAQACLETLAFGVSSEASAFLHEVSRELYSMNVSTFWKIRDGSLSGDSLDAKLVRMEQTLVQKKIDGLPTESRDRIVGSINEAFQDRSLAAWGSSTDRDTTGSWTRSRGAWVAQLTLGNSQIVKPLVTT